jgi:tetratricopeptide (TPR) repeat protein
MPISIRKMLFTAALLLGCSLIPIMTAQAQIRSIKGVVTDADTGKPIANAKIFFQGIDIVRTMEGKTNSKGEYIYLLGVQGGNFRIIVHAQGYQPSVAENIRPEIAEEKVQNFKLVPGEDRKTVHEMSQQEKAEYDKNAAEQQNTARMNDSTKKDFAAAAKFVSEGKYAESIDLFKKVIEKFPKEAPLHVYLAESYIKIAKNEEALDSYKTAVQLKPDTAVYWANMGILLNSMGKTAESQEAFKKAIELDPKSAAGSYYALGATLVNAGQTDQAAEVFKKSIEADANYAESYYQLGICLSGKPETMKAAVEALKKYISIGKKPDQVDVAKQLIAALEGK